MTFNEFNILDLDEKANIVWNNGTWLADRKQGSYNLLLYQIENFYAEVCFSNKFNRITDVKGFESDDPLRPYLNNFTINDLFAEDIIQYQTALYNTKYKLDPGVV